MHIIRREIAEQAGDSIEIMNPSCGRCKMCLWGCWKMGWSPLVNKVEAL
jgi:hypothetical protein